MDGLGFSMEEKRSVFQLVAAVPCQDGSKRKSCDFCVHEVNWGLLYLFLPPALQVLHLGDMQFEEGTC